MKTFCFALCLILLATCVLAHDARPAYLQISEIQKDRYSVLLKLPLRNGKVPEVTAVFNGCLIDSTTLHSSAGYESASFEYVVACEGGLHGQSVSFQGLDDYQLNVLVQFNRKEGEPFSALVHPKEPDLLIPADAEGSHFATSFLFLGIEHILFGIDHLLFVFGLLLLVNGWKNLLKTITAFTIAHSITLSLSVLGFISVPSAPVEATIALSIVFLAVEILKSKQRTATSLIVLKPWLVAFSFGLLHGFGFAGALSETGLPADNIPAALFLFNVGVETGQIIFILFVLPLFWILQKLPFNIPGWLQKAPAYAIGCLAAFWTIERAWTIF